jgi:hypothetical protein
MTVLNHASIVALAGLKDVGTLRLLPEPVGYHAVAAWRPTAMPTR